MPSPLRRARVELFLISLLILFLELACIRWFPAHVLFLTFFTNVVLLACFLGMSVGCLAAGHARSYIHWTPWPLSLAVLGALGVEALMARGVGKFVDVGHQASPQLVYFGTEYFVHDVAQFSIPIEVIIGCFFLLIALTLVGPGQQLGRALGQIPNRVEAYTINVLGSLVGVALFAGFSYWHRTPVWWFAPIVLALGYYLAPGRGDKSTLLQRGPRFLLLLVALAATNVHTGERSFKDEHGQHDWAFYWSPYYRIDYEKPPVRNILVNLIGHQTMVSRAQPRTAAYALPHLLNRDSGGEPFGEVLIIGAGSGNDVSRALQWGATSIDAVEIDPTIQELGKHDHPDQPYADTRVHPILDDGRNYLRAVDKTYDLVIYALVDSLVLQSSYSNIRLESYLFTQEAFADVRRHLKPGGMFVMYNYFRQGWIVARLHDGLQEAFGESPLVLTLPYRAAVAPEELFGGFTVFLAGSVPDGAAASTEHPLARLRAAFASTPAYWLRADGAAGPDTPNGFQITPSEAELTARTWNRFALAEVQKPAEPMRTATDDWPFLYLRQPMIPDLTLRGIAMMSALALLLLFVFRPKAAASGPRARFDGRLFFLGAGFMLIETKAVVHMALLFGSTWVVNSVVFFAVLVMIASANLIALAVRPKRLQPYYGALFFTLALNALIPLGAFLGMGRAAQVGLSCALVFAPIVFAGVLFAVSFGRTAEPDRAFGANIAGAMFGGLAENTSMLLGFHRLMLVAIAFYAFSVAWGWWAERDALAV